MIVETHRISPHPPLRRVVLALAAVMHLLAVVVAPLVEAKAERVAVVHVEEEGTDRHHAHTETTCIVCAGHPLVANAAPSAYRVDLSSRLATIPAALSLLPTHSAGGAPVGSRAPPSTA